MKKSSQDATREAAGCFCMLILGAILTLGTLVVVLPGLSGLATGKYPPGLWRSALIWMVTPIAGIAVVAWLTYGLPRRREPPRRR